MFEIIIFTYYHNISHIFIFYIYFEKKKKKKKKNYNSIPIHYNVFSFSKMYQIRNSALGILKLIIGYFNIFGIFL